MSTTQKTLHIFWKYTSRYPTLFWPGTIGAVLGVIAQDIIPPLIISRAFALLQNTTAAQQQVTFTEITPYVLGFVVSMMAGLVVWRAQSYAVWEYQIRATRDMIVDIFDHLQHQGQKFHADRFGGALVSQVNKYMSAYERLMDEFTWSIVTGLTALFATSLVLCFVSYKFAILLVVVVSGYMAIMTWRIKLQFPYNRREAESESNRTAALADAITNSSNVRAFAREEYELALFSKAANHTFDAYRKLSWQVFKNETTSHTITNSLRIVAFLFGLVAVTNWQANASVLYLVISYTSSIVDRLWQFGRIMRNINRSFGDAAEMTEILEIKPEIVDPKNPEPMRIVRGAIEFDNVTFGHTQEDNLPLFDNLSFRIKPGEKIGLVGPSGSGKTTLTRLLLRFMDIPSGSITIDKQDITRVSQRDLRSHIAYVPQEPLLFHRSIRENIGYGELNADDQAIHGVAKLAHAHDFIQKLPKGYDTLVGERGVKLSGGQRQRIAIARAMLKNAQILVLDEATSALDSESEQLIQDALWKLMENRTALVIAHRLSTIQQMDRIIVLKDGAIAEQGSHKELIRQKGVYADLWSRQSGGFLQQ